MVDDTQFKNAVKSLPQDHRLCVLYLRDRLTDLTNLILQPPSDNLKEKINNLSSEIALLKSSLSKSQRESKELSQRLSELLVNHDRLMHITMHRITLLLLQTGEKKPFQYIMLPNGEIILYDIKPPFIPRIILDVMNRVNDQEHIATFSSSCLKIARIIAWQTSKTVLLSEDPFHSSVMFTFAEEADEIRKTDSMLAEKWKGGLTSKFIYHRVSPEEIAAEDLTANLLIQAAVKWCNIYQAFKDRNPKNVEELQALLKQNEPINSQGKILVM